MRDLQFTTTPVALTKRGAEQSLSTITLPQILATCHALTHGCSRIVATTRGVNPSLQPGLLGTKKNGPPDSTGGPFRETRWTRVLLERRGRRSHQSGRERHVAAARGVLEDRAAL